jgi:hypothetical protein
MHETPENKHAYGGTAFAVIPLSATNLPENDDCSGMCGFFAGESRQPV